MLRKILLLLLMLFVLVNESVMARSDSDRPLRYRDTERHFKQAGYINVKNYSNNLGILNYSTGSNYKYNATMNCNYNTSSGINYRPATNLRYR